MFSQEKLPSDLYDIFNIIDVGATAAESGLQRVVVDALKAFCAEFNRHQICMLQVLLRGRWVHSNNATSQFGAVGQMLLKGNQITCVFCSEPSKRTGVFCVFSQVLPQEVRFPREILCFSSVFFFGFRLWALESGGVGEVSRLALLSAVEASALVAIRLLPGGVGSPPAPRKTRGG